MMGPPPCREDLLYHLASFTTRGKGPRAGHLKTQGAFNRRPAVGALHYTSQYCTRHHLDASGFQNSPFMLE